MKFIKTLCLFLSIFFLFGIISCSNSTDTPNEQTESETPNSSNVISSDGGTVTVSDKLSIKIPENALSEDTEISANYISDISDGNSGVTKDSIPLNFLSMAEFGPSGTQFSVPAEVTLELGKTPANKEVSIYCFNEEEKIWCYEGSASVNGTKATFNVSHFSKYVAMDITPGMMDYFDVLVKAYAPDDAKIISEFKDYLVNECDVMEYITIWKGFYYRPRHLLVSGDYYNNGVENENSLVDTSGKEYDEKNTLFSITGSSTSCSSEYYKKVEEAKNSSENKYVSRCLASIQYEMIEPEISVTATNTELKVGESCQLRIWCIDPQGDLDLNDYPLSITTNNSFSVSKTKVTTDAEGRAEVTVTRNSNEEGKITVTFDEKDTDGNPVTSSCVYTFDEIAEGNNFNVVLTYKSTYFVEEAPGSSIMYGTQEDFNCPDHSFECEVLIKGNYEIVPLSDSVKNSEIGKAGNVNSVVIGSATFKGNPSKTKYDYPSSHEKYISHNEYLGDATTEYTCTYSASIKYNDKSVNLIGLLFNDGKIKMSLRENCEPEKYRNVTEAQLMDLFLYCSDIDLDLADEYADTDKGVISEKITITSKGTLFNEPFNDSNDLNKNICPMAYISTSSSKGTHLLSVNSTQTEENNIYIPIDDMNIPSGYYTQQTDLSFEFIDATITF